MRRPPPTEIARARRRAAAGRPRRLAVRAQPPPRGGSRPSGRRGRREVGRRERPSWPRGRRLPPAPRRPHDREAGRRTQRAWQALRQHDCPERRARIRAAETREGVENGELLTQRLLDAEAGEAPPQRLERRDRRLQRTRDNLGTDGLDIRRPRLLDRFEQIVVRKRRHGRRGRRSRRLRGEAGCHPAAVRRTGRAGSASLPGPNARGRIAPARGRCPMASSSSTGADERTEHSMSSVRAACGRSGDVAAKHRSRQHRRSCGPEAIALRAVSPGMTKTAELGCGHS